MFPYLRSPDDHHWPHSPPGPMSGSIYEEHLTWQHRTVPPRMDRIMVRPREKMTERARAAQASPHPTGLQPDVTRRTTVILRSEDISNLKEIGAETGTTDTETIRRAIRLMKDLLLWQ